MSRWVDDDAPRSGKLHGYKQLMTGYIGVREGRPNSAVGTGELMVMIIVLFTVIVL